MNESQKIEVIDLPIPRLEKSIDRITLFRIKSTVILALVLKKDMDVDGVTRLLQGSLESTIVATKVDYMYDAGVHPFDVVTSHQQAESPRAWIIKIHSEPPTR